MENDFASDPPGWVQTSIGEVAVINPKTSFEDLPSDAPIPFVPMAAVAEETGKIDYSKTRPMSEVSKGYVRFAEGDVLFAKITPCMENGKVAPVGGMPGGVGAGSTEFHVLRPRAVDQRFLWYWLVDRGFRAEASHHMSGSAGQLRVPVDYLRNAVFRLPPLPEQRRIVAKIDELFFEIAEGEESLADARTGLEVFRRSLLKAAVTGELTRDWRLNAVADRSASALPDGWHWSSLGQIAEITGGVTVDKKRKPADPVTVPYLRVANVQRGHVDLSDVKQIVVEKRTANRLRLQPGDILMNEGGDRDKIGRGWVWDGSTPDMIHQNHVFRVRPRTSEINSYFVSHYANEMGRHFFVEQGKQTTNLASISLTKIATLPVPVPPSREAAEIIHRVNERLTGIADSLALLDAKAADTARLKQSILKVAFEGRLVTQDERDEPASTLLARLGAAERTQAKASRRTKVPA